MSIEEKNIDGEKEVYYVIYKEPKDNSFKREIGIAKLDQETKCFYDYFYRPGNLNYDELEVGQKVTIDEWKNIVLIDKSINEEVLRIIKKNEMLSEELEKKYGERGAYDQNGNLPHIEDIIYEFVKDRFKSKKPLDFYIIEILNVLCKEMWLKVSNNSFSNLAFSYPESVYEVISAMYDIIAENLSKNETMELILYKNGGVNEEYKQFLREIERRTRFNMPRDGSELLANIRYEAYVNTDHTKKWKE